MKNRLGESFLLVFVSVLFFFSLSLVRNDQMIFFSHKLKEVKLLSDIVSSGKLKKAPLTEKVLKDSIVEANQQLIALKSKDPRSIMEFTRDGNQGGLTRFFESLSRMKKGKKKIRIAYFGDSMIEGDLITQDIRKLLQEKFGGEGVGFVPVTSIVAGFRQTILHSFSNNWDIHNLLDPGSEKYTLGISGYVFEPLCSLQPNIQDALQHKNEGSWVKYGAVGKARLNRFCNVKLFYGNSVGDNYIACNHQRKKLEGTSAVNELLLTEDNSIRALSANFVCQSPVDIYGFSFESDSGAFVDNFSFRGNSGMALTKIPEKVLHGLNDFLEYDLIVLQYGVNVIDHKVTDYSWYEKGMTQVVNHFKASFPDASILIVSAGDKGLRQNGEYITDPAVPLVVEAQRKVAENTSTAFWNLYESMGGYNSMVKWVEGDTVMANKDYTHFNFRGANRVATMLYKYLIDKHDEFNKKKVKLG